MERKVFLIHVKKTLLWVSGGHEYALLHHHVLARQKLKGFGWGTGSREVCMNMQDKCLEKN